jgi:hypothetical protein
MLAQAPPVVNCPAPAAAPEGPKGIEQSRASHHALDLTRLACLTGLPFGLLGAVAYPAATAPSLFNQNYGAPGTWTRTSF